MNIPRQFSGNTKNAVGHKSHKTPLIIVISEYGFKVYVGSVG